MQSEKPPKSPPKRIAIIGGGISGMACAWKLRHHDCTIDIYESDSRLGGHANSVPFEGNGRSVNVDTGFIAMNDATYPQFNELLSELGVETIPTDMSFGVSTADGRIEWGSYSAWSFLGKLSNLFNLWFWRLAFDVLRFSLFARDIIDGDTSDSGYGAANDSARRARGDDDDLEEALKKIHFEPIGEYLRRQAYSDQFMTYFLIPMVAAPWCVDPDEFARSFPARILIKFMLTHGLLDTVSKTLRWRSFRGGSKTYVDVFQKRFASQSCRIHLNSAIRNVARSNDGVCLTFSNHSSREYDHAVLAVPANQALRLLGDDATAIERKILGSFKTTENMCYLHSDVSVCPRLSARCRRLTLPAPAQTSISARRVELYALRQSHCQRRRQSRSAFQGMYHLRHEQAPGHSQPQRRRQPRPGARDDESIQNSKPPAEQAIV
ncbi:FAD/NAD(P)-binding domain-containing protein [Polyplosphaeria fusca]|uniref:FAD/NAD(P)-binding domain-containing protein n=1 Tax=Polyplosphaeria fusca TaxID=682080 RepID=A0A9P4QHK8_9PLEO|nr:FAD/NAD(P)-binding domain-containing protein [Polyplosphaeria fusca]